MKRDLATATERSPSPGPRTAKRTKTAAIMAHVKLNEDEQRLRKLLLGAANSIDRAGKEPVVLRWAGGWVRDKLLGTESNDIDVAINVMTGADFITHLKEYLSDAKVIEHHQLKEDEVGKVYNVAANPEKSKHLETASVKIFGLDLDFVNLRKEVYSDISRNPTMEFGTIEEDAERRDATINALFYNLGTDLVEDYVGGLADLRNGIIRTPTEPLQTFTDDPLRVLRLVRFASRLQFEIAEETMLFMGNAGVLESLRVKISRERVGIELEKMLRGKFPRRALSLIDDLDLYEAVFTDPAQSAAVPPLRRKWSVAYKCLYDVMQNHSPMSIYDLLITKKEAEFMAWNLAALSPWMTADPGSEAESKKKRYLPPPAKMAWEGYRASNKVSDVIAASFNNRVEIMELKEDILAKAPRASDNGIVGMALRRWELSGSSWKLQVLNAILVDAAETLAVWDLDKNQDEEAVELQRNFLKDWQTVLDWLVDLDAPGAVNVRPLLTGLELSKALGVKPGRWTGAALNECVRWQLRHPGETDPSGAVEEIRAQAERLDLPLNP